MIRPFAPLLAAARGWFLPRWLLLPMWVSPVLLLPRMAAAAPNGAELYRGHCAMCHGAEGLGVPGAFPPLAGSDFLVKQREKSLRAPLEGLAGRIEVNGRSYEGVMPPVMLNDEQIAAVFAYIFSSWGNSGPAPTRQEIASLRAATKYPTFAKLLAFMSQSQLPAAPEGWTLRVAAELTFSPVRIASHADGKSVLLLADIGDVWVTNPDDGKTARLWEGKEYLDPALGYPATLGITVDRKQRLYIVSNQRNTAMTPVRNEVTIFRTGPWSAETGWGRPQPWLRTSYPFGVGPYNHGVSHIAEGPDGFLYVNSGSRTDGGEPGTSPKYATTGEDPLTACIWRIDPEAAKPEIEVFTRGLRNSFGFCWDAQGHFVATENGPDAHAGEELNLIEKGRHYGFPYQFSDWTTKAYPHTPDTPPGLVITKPFRNTGPDAGGNAKGYFTFEPHSCPSGIVWLEPDWPAPFGGGFATVRFGNLIKLEQDTGFDLLLLRPDFEARTTTAQRILFPLGRPQDVLKLPGHRLAIAEFARTTTLAAGLGTPGRLLILAPAKETALSKGAAAETAPAK